MTKTLKNCFLIICLTVSISKVNGKDFSSTEGNLFKRKKSSQIFNCNLGKIIVYSGWPFENGVKVEVIDLLNEDSDCDLFPDLHFAVQDAFGGRIDNDYVLCGGGNYEDPDYKSDQCYHIGEREPFVKMTRPLISGSTVILPNQTLFMTGTNFICSP